MRAWIGTSGFAYPAWKGRFYPRGLPAAGMLAYYAARFDAVEINSTFYRMPRADALAAWRDGVPDDFRFTAKVPGLLTHRLRLRGIAEPASRFVGALAGFGAKRGPALLQLPPALALDLPLLEDALATWPKAQPVAVEFRHASWFTDSVYDALRRSGAALCVAVSDELETPRVTTAGWGYLRLRRSDHPAAELDGWAEWIAAQRWDACHAFLKHEDEARGPRFAARLATALASHGISTRSVAAAIADVGVAPQTSARLSPRRKEPRAPAPRRGASRTPRAPRRS